nr:MAG TPA: Protein of unknown function (DUF2680) [Caudoviricetes sp.]
MNPLFNELGGQSAGPFGNFQQLMHRFQQFRQTFKGDPKAEVEKMLQSGQITQQQLDQAQALAQQFRNLM